MTLADRLSALGEARGRGWQAALARHCGVKSPSVADWVSGKTRSLEGENLLRAAEFFDVEPLWLASGRGPKFRAGRSDPTTLHPILAWEHESDLPEGDFVLIPRLAVTADKPGEPTVKLLQETPQAFRADWIRKRELNTSKLACMVARGDAMEDRIHDGDALVVDTSDREVSDGRVYAIWYDGGERVRRLYRLPGGGLRVKTDKPTYPELALDAAQAQLVYVIGRVVYVAGESGL